MKEQRREKRKGGREEEQGGGYDLVNVVINRQKQAFMANIISRFGDGLTIDNHVRTSRISFHTSKNISFA